VKHPRLLALLPAFAGVTLTLALGIGLAGSHAVAETQPVPGQPTPPPGALTPPPPPAPNGTFSPFPAPTPVPVGSPTGSPSGRGRRARPAPASAEPSPTETPTSPAFATLDGTWEVQVQYRDRTLYSYLKITQTQSTLGGTWNVNAKAYPLDGSYDGRLIRIVVKEPTGNVVLSGYVEGATDMVGLVDYGKGDPVAFTAEHRALPPKNPLKRY